MPYLQSNVPYFKAWVRREYTVNNERYHGEFIHAMAVAVTTMPERCLSFQVIFTGAETYDNDEPNVHDGLTVDYAKFTKLTKNMLKNAHVVRQKSLKCSPRLSQIISSHGTRSKQLDSRE